jgi:MarR family transcriptional regulator, 2-MHQ and catechol-resistance regulon repressor
MKSTEQYGSKIDTALSLWVKLVRAHDTVAHLTAANIRSFNLTPAQFGAIECLGHLGTLLMGDLTKKHLVSGGNMTVVINNLEKEGLVKRKVSADDRRAFYVSLTPKGKRLFDKIFFPHAEYVAKLASVLTEAEQVELSRLLKKLGTGAAEQTPAV